mgnify:FL=1
MRKQRTEYKDYRFLSREEEIAAWESGDHNALVESVWPFVLRTIRKLCDQEDQVYCELISEAGLIMSNAIRTYDAHKSRFISYSCRFLEAQLATAAKRFREQSNVTLSDLVFDTMATTPAADPFELDQAKSDLREVVVTLRMVCTDTEYDVFQRRAEGETFVQIGTRYGFTRQRAQQLFESAKAKAREQFPSLVEIGD